MELWVDFKVCWAESPAINTAGCRVRVSIAKGYERVNIPLIEGNVHSY